MMKEINETLKRFQECDQIHLPFLRFYLVSANDKIPLERKWNDFRNYSYDDRVLHQHLANGGNYGIVMGFGRLIAIDYDDQAFYDQTAHLLPKTFTIQTAKKRLFHKYYFYSGKMFKKIGIDIDGKRVCDIQAQGSGLIAPGSTIDRKFYDIADKSDIAEITLEQLQAVFKFTPEMKKIRVETYKEEYHPDKIQKAIKILKFLKVKNTKGRHYQCPFHPMTGGGNFWINEEGKLHCFHCGRHFFTLEDFINEFAAFKKDPALAKLLKVIMDG